MMEGFVDNWKYDFMRPSIDEIVSTYVKRYGPEQKEDDLELDSSEEEEEEGEGEEGTALGSSSCT